jgi:Mn2+/Fe2+ NRAMP family transporter
VTTTPAPQSPGSAPGSVGWLAVIGPGILVAATGVGTGDLVTGALAGTKLGVAVLWAALAGAMVKFVLNEGLARWQLATGETVLEGVRRHFGKLAIGLFLAYLLLWTYVLAAALMSASGAAMHAILPLGDADRDKLMFGIAHSALAVALVELGGYRLFEKVMKVCIALMFVTVVITAVAVRPDWSDVLRGLLIPSLPADSTEGLRWTIGLMGGVGGTVTVLCYGYWIREEGRESPAYLKACRIDLAVGYAMTALFGIAMVIIGSQITVSGKSVMLLVTLADTLGERLGTAARWTFLIGAWGAIFSSLLGVWQSVPYLFADTLRLLRHSPLEGQHDATTPPQHGRVYRTALYLMASVPIAGMFGSFASVQLTYAVCGALFIPMLAIALLLLNGSAARIGNTYRNRPLTTVTLVAAVLMFIVYGYLEVRPLLG